MKKILNYPIRLNENGQSVAQYLKWRGFSRHLLIRLKKTPAGIMANNVPVPANYILQPGDVLTLTLEEPESSPHIVPTAMDLDIVYEDEDLLVVNKPAGLPIHPSQGHFDHTLANGMAWYFQQRGENFVYRAINRLDRDTSGLLILARHALSGALLSEMVKNRSIHRRYLAIAKGAVLPEGIITAPIAREEGSTIKRCVDFENGDYACTRFRLVCYNPFYDCSLVKLALETGRTHQIRVHMEHIGFPLIGDFLYNPDLSLISRQALHSHSLAFVHPLTGQDLAFEAPLPKDMTFIFEHPGHGQPAI